MTNLLIDWNFFFHKTLGVFTGFGKKDAGDVLSTEDDQASFTRKIMTDLCYAIGQLPIDGRIICCKDSRSWRKDLKVERNHIYKGSRKKEVGTDWGCFFELMDKLGDYLETRGYIYSKFPKAEGDDLLWAWNKQLREKGENVIVLSGDHDLHQLISMDEQSWTICWNCNSKNNKAHVPAGFIEHITKEEEITVFNFSISDNIDQNKFQKFITSSVIEEVDPFRLSFQKILTGDKKDDVPSVWIKEVNGKYSRFTPSKAEAAYNFFLESGWSKYSRIEDFINDPEYLKWIAGLILRIVGENDNVENRNKARTYYIENAQLVFLSESVLPQDMVNGIFEQISQKNEFLKK